MGRPLRAGNSVPSFRAGALAAARPAPAADTEDGRAGAARPEGSRSCWRQQNCRLLTLPLGLVQQIERFMDDYTYGKTYLDPEHVKGGGVTHEHVCARCLRTRAVSCGLGAGCQAWR